MKKYAKRPASLIAPPLIKTASLRVAATQERCRSPRPEVERFVRTELTRRYWYRDEPSDVFTHLGCDLLGEMPQRLMVRGASNEQAIAWVLVFIRQKNEYQVFSFTHKNRHFVVKSTLSDTDRRRSAREQILADLFELKTASLPNELLRDFFDKVRTTLVTTVGEIPRPTTFDSKRQVNRIVNASPLLNRVAWIDQTGATLDRAWNGIPTVKEHQSRWQPLELIYDEVGKLLSALPLTSTALDNEAKRVFAEEFERQEDELHDDSQRLRTHLLFLARFTASARMQPALCRFFSHDEETFLPMGKETEKEKSSQELERALLVDAFVTSGQTLPKVDRFGHPRLTTDMLREARRFCEHIIEFPPLE